MHMLEHWIDGWYNGGTVSMSASAESRPAICDKKKSPLAAASDHFVTKFAAEAWIW